MTDVAFCSHLLSKCILSVTLPFLSMFIFQMAADKMHRIRSFISEVILPAFKPYCYDGDIYKKADIVLL